MTPHTPAAFINTIAESGTKAEAVEWLQRIWNERCEFERDAVRLRSMLGDLLSAAQYMRENWGRKNPYRKNSENWIDWESADQEQFYMIDAAIDEAMKR